MLDVAMVCCYVCIYLPKSCFTVCGFLPGMLMIQSQSSGSREMGNRQRKIDWHWLTSQWPFLCGGIALTVCLCSRDFFLESRKMCFTIKEISPVSRIYTQLDCVYQFIYLFSFLLLAYLSNAKRRTDRWNISRGPPLPEQKLNFPLICKQITCHSAM